MERIELGTPDLTQENIQKLGELFPQVLTEVQDENGQVQRAVDFDALRDLLGDVAEGTRERYQFTWPGKREAKAEARRPIHKTMRPCPEESVNWDTTENLYIEGDNLDALRILKETYAGKVKMIYIDPPYNTGHDFVYDDDFAKTHGEYAAESGDYDGEGGRLVANPESNGRFHSDWCSMMYPRLMLARDLLSADGVIFISIDANEHVNQKKVCDEIFGEANYVVDFVWVRKKKPSFLHRNVGTMTEYVVCYSKCSEETKAFSIESTTEGKKYPFNNAGNAKAVLSFPKGAVTFLMSDSVIQPQDMSTGNIYTKLLDTLEIRLGKNANEFRLEGEWRYSQAKVNELVGEGSEIVISKIPFRPNLVKAGGEVKKMRNLLSPECYEMETNEDATAQLFDLFGGTFFDTPKPVKLIKSLVLACTYDCPDAFVLDFFSGSATTAHAVMQLNAEDGGNRKYVLVQLPEETDAKSEAAKAGYANICEIGKERIRRAGAKIAAEVEETNKHPKLGEEPKKVPDIGFRVLKIDSTNFTDTMATPDNTSQQMLLDFSDNLKGGRSDMDILFEVLPKFQIPYSAKIEELSICGKRCFSVDDGYLLACFDRNVDTDTIEAIAKMQPYYAIMRDASMADDATHANFEELFKTYSPDTIRRVI